MKLERVFATTKWVKGFVSEVHLDEAFDAFGAPVVLASGQDSIADTDFGVAADTVDPNNRVRPSIKSKLMGNLPFASVDAGTRSC